MNEYSELWTLDPHVTFLNHGSFGACPKAILEAQQEYRMQMERQPVQFFMREIEGLLFRARLKLGEFLDARPEQLVFVSNATTGVNVVLRSLEWGPEDEILITQHIYNACRNAVEHVASKTGARVVLVGVPFPLQSPDHVTESILRGVTSRTRLALIDHVTSATGLIFPVAEIVRELHTRGVEVLVDGAHAPGMIPLHLEALGADYYTGNCHKWMCAPKGAAFLYVRPEHENRIRPLVISHGANTPLTQRSRFQMEFDWVGTQDMSSFFTLPDAIEYMGGLVPGGWAALMKRNHDLVCEARELLCQALGVLPPCPNEMLGSLATISLPSGSLELTSSPMRTHPFQDQILHRFGIEVPIFSWPSPPQWKIRISAQIYNELAQYRKLGDALNDLLKSESTG